MSWPEENETKRIRCCPWRICRRVKKDNKDNKEERSPIVTRDEEGTNKTGYGTTHQSKSLNGNAPDTTGANEIGNSSPVMPPPRQQQPTNNTKERMKMELLGLAKVDEIFEQFQESFDAFYNCQDDMETAVREFKMAVKTTGEFRACLTQFNQQLNGQRVVIKKLALKFPKAVLKGEKSVGDAAKALVSIFKAYNDMEKLPVNVISKSIDCLKYVMKLDISEIAGQQFGGSGFDLKVRANMNEIKKAPKIVSSFFEYATSIVMDVIEVFGDDKNKEELRKKKEKVEKEMKKKNDEFKKLVAPEPPKEIKFTSLGIPTVDRIFNDIAKLVNPVVILSKDLFDTRKHLEQAMKAVSEFRDDPSKAFDDYLEELKKRLKKGDVHIEISMDGNRIEIEKVEGLEPKATQDMQSGFEGVLKSGDEFIDLAPDSIKKLIELIPDISSISKSDIKNHVTFKELPSKLSALNENSKQARKIPDDLKFFLCFVRNLIMDILQVLHTKKDEAQGSEEGNDNIQATE